MMNKTILNDVHKLSTMNLYGLHKAIKEQNPLAFEEHSKESIKPTTKIHTEGKERFHKGFV